MSCILLSMAEARLPPGFRFHPRDEELVCYYLEKKVTGGGGGAGNINNGSSCSSHGNCPMMIDVDLNKCEPWDLPKMACVGGKEWYFYSLRDRKYATGQRTNRATQSGYWKATGKDRRVSRMGLQVGMRKTLVFYQGRAPQGKKTHWVMHEFRLQQMESTTTTTTAAHPPTLSSLNEHWVLCRVFYKSRGGGSTMEAAQTSSYVDDHTNSSSLTYTFPPASSSLEGHGQVSCFSDPPPTSVFLQDVAAPPPPLSLIERSMQAKISQHMGGLPEFHLL